MSSPFNPNKPGRLITSSKSDYVKANPKNKVVFNANIFVKEGLVWYGDLDITVDAESLIEFRNNMKTDLFIFYELDELDGRGVKPDFSKAVAIVREDHIE